MWGRTGSFGQDEVANGQYQEHLAAACHYNLA